MDPLRILIVDDSSLARKFIKDALSSLDEVEIVGMVSNGNDALLRADALIPDVVTLDVEMPGMNGIDVLSGLQKNGFSGAVVMLSSSTKQGAPLTIKALELGAFDFILKPSLDSVEENSASLQEMFLPVAQAIQQRKKIHRSLQGRSSKISNEKSVANYQRPLDVSAFSKMGYGLKKPSQIVAIGVSTGGPKALAKIIPNLSANLSVPVVIVQHMPRGFTMDLANNLNSKSSITVREAQDEDVLRPATVYIAQGGRQMKVIHRDSEKIIKITDDPPENSCRPSVNYLFRSIADVYGGNSTAVILTGMGNDGVKGVELMKKLGARVIVQDQETSVVFGMPKAVIDSGAADAICSLDTIADELSLNLIS